MTYAFQYVPTSGDLSGKAFEEQTERAINEIGGIAEQGGNAAREALDIANGAVSTANDAVNTAQQANQTAREAKDAADGLAGTVRDAADAASEARRRADDARAVADTANSAAATAANTANGAQQEASGARETAEDAQNAAREARQTASAAQATAELALQAADGGVYVTNASPLDADTEFETSARWHLTDSGIMNIPLAAPVYLDVEKDDYDTSVVQVARSASGSGPFASCSRAGRVTVPLNEGTDTYAITIDGATAMTVVVTAAGDAIAVAPDGGGMFTPGIESPAKVSGTLEVPLPGGADVTVSVNGTEVAAVAGGLLVFSSTVVAGARSQIVIDAAESSLSGIVLSLAVTFDWTDQGTPSVAWGAWTSMSADAAQAAAEAAQATAEAAQTVAHSMRSTWEAALAVAGGRFAPNPRVTNGIGQWSSFAAPVVTIAPGGTWAIWYFEVSASGAVLSGPFAYFVAGGTVIDGGNAFIRGFMWRMA